MHVIHMHFNFAGALYGAAYGMAAFPQRFVDGLHEGPQKLAEIDQLITLTAAAADTCA